MTVGATPGQIVAMIMRQAGLFIGAGTLAGGALAVAAGGVLAALLRGVDSRDWISHGAGVGAMTVLARATCWILAHGFVAVPACRLNPLFA